MCVCVYIALFGELKRIEAPRNSIPVPFRLCLMTFQTFQAKPSDAIGRMVKMNGFENISGASPRPCTHIGKTVLFECLYGGLCARKNTRGGFELHCVSECFHASPLMARTYA